MTTQTVARVRAEMPALRIRRVRRQLIIAAIIATLAVAGLGGKAWWGHVTSDVRHGTTRVDLDGMAARYGIHVDLLAVTAAGGLVELRYQVVDPDKADHGHCLEIDIRSHYARGKRRLILVQTPEDRQALDDMKRFLVGLDCSPDGPEGNYRQRLYRLKKLVPDQ